MFLDIIIYIAAMVGAVLLAKRWSKNNTVRKNWVLWTVLAVIGIIVTGFLTYHAPDWLVFRHLG